MKKKVKKPRSVRRLLVDKANSLANPLADQVSFHELLTENDGIIKLSCARTKDLDSDCLEWLFDLTQRNLKDLYSKSKWGWNWEEKRAELTDPAAWQLIASREKEFFGYSHFRFDLDFGVPVLYCYEIQLEPSARRKGLGRFMMSALESIAFTNRMEKVVLTSLKHNPTAMHFYHALGYRLDETSPPASEGADYVILSKYRPTEESRS